jgi:uncharacterized membrane protein
MERSELKRQAKEAIKGNLWAIVAILIVVYVAQMALSYATFWAGGIGSLLISGSVSISVAMIFLKLLKKHKKPQVEDVLLGFKNGNFGRGFIGYLRMTVFTMLWSLLFIIPGLIKSFSYSQMFYLMADDPKLEPSEAQARSMEIMDGHKMELFKLYLSFIPWLLLVGITLGIALIYVLPYMSATFATYYNYVKKVSK